VREGERGGCGPPHPPPLGPDRVVACGLVVRAGVPERYGLPAVASAKAGGPPPRRKRNKSVCCGGHRPFSDRKRELPRCRTDKHDYTRN